MRTRFSNEVSPIQQKGRRIPMHLEKRVEAELIKFIDQKHNIKLEKCLDRQVISPIILTVKKDQTVKLDLDSKKKKQIHPEKQESDANYRLSPGQHHTSSQIGQIKTNTIFNARLKLRVFTNPIGYINQRTL